MVTKGEAEARVVSVNAEAEAQRTTLEGNAEAGITFTKGEAEAKALALRAEAYRQFNEAAIIQTVLSMLPEIVRAAAEPMANIDTLTVLSNDGASDVVRNVTRTVTEASATVKGLTGIDIPALDQQRRRAARSRRPVAQPVRRGRGAADGGTAAAGVVGRAAAGAARTGPGACGARRRSPASAAAASADAPTPDESLGRLGPRQRRALRRRPPEPRIETPAAADAAMAAADQAIRPRRGVDARRTPARTDTAAGPARPAGGARPASADITSATTVDEAADQARLGPARGPGHRALRGGPAGRPRDRRAAPAAHDVADLA